MRYFLRLSYRGFPFHGWQRQPNACSVQQTVEEALQTVLRESTPIVGAGRTDTGVNARCMFAHFDTPAPIADPRRFLNGMNRLCGHDIAFYDLIPVADDAHARFDATRRTYKYFITPEKSAFLDRSLAWHCPSPLDLAAMNRCAELLLQTEDFTSFAKLHSDAKTNICHISRCDWQREICNITGEEMLVFTISADRFLRNMVRAVVGTLVEAGRGKLDFDGFRAVVEARDRCEAGTSVPPQALTLWDVEYPYIPISNR